MAQPEFFGLVEVDFGLGAAGTGLDGRPGVKFEIGGRQVPGSEILNCGAIRTIKRAQGAPLMHAALEDFGVVDFDFSLFDLNI